MHAAYKCMQTCAAHKSTGFHESRVEPRGRMFSGWGEGIFLFLQMSIPSTIAHEQLEANPSHFLVLPFFGIILTPTTGSPRWARGRVTIGRSPAGTAET